MLKALTHSTLLTLAALAAPLHANEEDPVSWAFTAKKIDDATHEAHLAATLGGGWHIYSQSTPAGGPVPTSIVFDANPAVTLKGDAKEVGELQKHFEPQFGVQVKQFSDKVSFVQTVSIKPGAKTTLTGTITYMACDDEQCLPPKDVKFSIQIG